MNRNNGITLEARGDEVARKVIPERVRGYFTEYFDVSETVNVLCMFDDIDDWYMKQRYGGSENRGFFEHVKAQDPQWPGYLRELIQVCGDDDNAYWTFDSFIYLHGSTCANELAMTLTFAHELQHFMQYANDRTLWEINWLISKYLQTTTFEIPNERQARIVAKRVAESLHGSETIERYIKEQIDLSSGRVRDDWEFIVSLRSSEDYDLFEDTLALVEKYKPALKQLQKSLCPGDDPDDAEDDPKLATIDLDNPGNWR